VFGQDAPVKPENDAPNPYRTIDNWGEGPGGRKWGSVSDVHIDPDGKSVWVLERCGQDSCVGKDDLDTIFLFDENGKRVRSFGKGMFVWPHGIFVDREGNVWATDGTIARAGKTETPRGHQVFKFSRDGKLLMTLGKAGVAGSGPDTFGGPSDVVVAPNGDIYVADGHAAPRNNRIVKFSKDGKFVAQFAKTGKGPGEINDPHGLGIDPEGRIYVADRANNRIAVFDKDGKFIVNWPQFSKAGSAYVRDGLLYSGDANSNEENHPGWKRGIRVGRINDGKIIAFIPDPNWDPKVHADSPEGVAVDAKGNIYGADIVRQDLKKYEKK
jgi:DNA-binding beta-propeller fold protein YncE